MVLGVHTNVIGTVNRVTTFTDPVAVIVTMAGKAGTAGEVSLNIMINVHRIRV